MLGDGHGRPKARSQSRSTALAELQRQGLVRHIGLSNVTLAQIAEAPRIVEIVCVQNNYNLAHRDDDALIDELAAAGHRLRAVLPARRLHAAAVRPRCPRWRRALGATPMQVALAWLLQRSPNILLIPGTSSVAHLRENLAAAELTLSARCVATLDRIGSGRTT